MNENKLDYTEAELRSRKAALSDVPRQMLVAAEALMRQALESARRAHDLAGAAHDAVIAVLDDDEDSRHLDAMCCDIIDFCESVRSRCRIEYIDEWEVVK